MALQQNFPDMEQPLIDPDTGHLNVVWFRFLITLWNRTGSATGNDSAAFNYPITAGNNGQVLTSQGAARPTIWTTVLTKLSQFANDVGFITSADVAGFSTPEQTDSQIAAANSAALATTVPPADSTAGS